MIYYYFVTVSIALLAVALPTHRRMPLLSGAVFVFLSIFVGLRHHVGMDWNNYLHMLRRANAGEWFQSLSAAEPSYALLLWMAGQSNLGIYGANFIGALIFFAGLFRFAAATPAPWVALTVAMPYLVLVISASAARQAIAIGWLLWIFAEWKQASVKKRAAFVMVAASFHYSACVFAVFLLIDSPLRSSVKFVGSIVFGLLVLVGLNSTGALSIYSNYYISSSAGGLIESSGAFFHVALNGLPAIFMLLLGRHRRRLLNADDGVIYYLSVLSIILILFSFFFSTAASRISVYLFPVSMWFFASFPLVFPAHHRTYIKLLTAICYVFSLAIWLAFANNAAAYKDYRNVIFIPESEREICCKQ